MSKLAKGSAAKLVLVMLVIFLSAMTTGEAQTSRLHLKISQVMTPQEFSDTGVSQLSQAQRNALDAWLNRYSESLIRVAASGKLTPSTPSRISTSADCSPAVESTIDGDFEGWDGDTIFKLSNGQIWQQVQYSYMYSYSYMPDVTIYKTSSGCKMKVEDESDTIIVKRIK